ncbi:acyl-CoA dehydrogenase family protein [Rhodococcus pyridinivorans]|uniref:acyl-CoA dehydrogenase family protein n=1 Tax=Rhodococcus pyridinivorans TaxID=103816 RepID=UPI001E58CC62|nr:acyl-CoA dehydrogenase family protein [Rhodococcus pyridinivorans]MCD5422438.1 acyl-CoA dehydrogenase family protein [Rhodococcus pyridinivorans]
MTITREELVDRARSLAPTIAARARETELLRRPHDDTITDLIDAELMQTLVPKRWGGHELGLDAHREIVEIISAACMSTGWIYAFYAGHNWMVARFSEQAQKELFSSRPFVLAPAATAPTLTVVPVDGGYVLNGRASWGSGIMHADWAICTGLDSSYMIRQFVVPVEDLSIVDVWHYAGMAGTGSNDFVLEDVFVPEHRSLPGEPAMMGGSEGSLIHDNPLYRMPLLPVVWAETVPVFSGALRGAADALADITRNRVTTHAQTVMHENKYAQIKLGEALVAASIAERLADNQVRQTEAAFGHPMSMDVRIGLKGQAGFIIEHCRKSVTEMVHNAGASNFRVDSPIQRHFRDISFLSTHAFFTWDVARELTGRHALGLEPNTPLI